MMCCECGFFATGLDPEGKEYHECENHDCPVLTPIPNEPACEFSRPKKGGV